MYATVDTMIDTTQHCSTQICLDDLRPEMSKRLTKSQVLQYSFYSVSNQEFQIIQICEIAKFCQYKNGGLNALHSFFGISYEQ